jgi:NAD(P)H-dependent FMN reductase
MALLQIIVASTREGRKGPAVGAWVEAEARAHGGFDVELVDLADVDLPLLDEPEHPRLRRYVNEHTIAWSETVDRADAFVFVVPEYNHSPAPSLINALDYLVQEWAYKPAAFVSYGGVSAGLRGVQALKPLLCALKIVPIVEAVAIPMFTARLDASGEFVGDERLSGSARTMFTELARWEQALRQLRA